MGSDVDKYEFWYKSTIGTRKSEDYDDDEDEGDYSRIALANHWVCRKIHPA